MYTHVYDIYKYVHTYIHIYMYIYMLYMIYAVVHTCESIINHHIKQHVISTQNPLDCSERRHAPPKRRALSTDLICFTYYIFHI